MNDTTEPLAIVGVDVPNVGTPRNDGTPGSALYAVPIKLSRQPSMREAEFLVHHWDHPTSWSTMHRPGIARVFDDCLVLDGTTVEEVRDRHAGMLKRVVEATNASEAEASARDEMDQAAETERLKAHRENVSGTASEIRFN